MGKAIEKKVAVIIVSHNSEKYLQKCIEKLKAQPSYIVIVDSGSKNLDYINRLSSKLDRTILLKENKGFCGANNIGFNEIKDEFEFVLFLNPDVFLPNDWIERAMNFINGPNGGRVGLLSGPLLGFEIESNQPTGKVDSFGIERNWWGRWFDNKMGLDFVDSYLPKQSFEPKAICGALMFCRVEAIRSASFKNGTVFDERFFMYKEDIDLSYRVKKKWKILIEPDLIAYHCRGWDTNRKNVTKWARVISARNEILVNIRIRSIFIPLSIIKFLYAKYFE